jgi:hypothetical protein
MHIFEYRIQSPNRAKKSAGRRSTPGDQRRDWDMRCEIVSDLKTPILDCFKLYSKNSVLWTVRISVTAGGLGWIKGPTFPLQRLVMVLCFQLTHVFNQANGNDIPRSGSLSFQHLGRADIIAYAEGV